MRTYYLELKDNVRVRKIQEIKTKLNNMLRLAAISTCRPELHIVTVNRPTSNNTNTRRMVEPFAFST